MLQEEDPTKYEAHFAKYIEAGIDAEKMEDPPIDWSFSRPAPQQSFELTIHLTIVFAYLHVAQEMYTEAHDKIREDPDGEKADKKDQQISSVPLMLTLFCLSLETWSIHVRPGHHVRERR